MNIQRLDRGPGSSETVSCDNLIDTTVFEVVKSAYRDPESPVKYILLVRTSLSEIAALFITEPVEGIEKRKQALQMVFSKRWVHWGEDDANIADIIAQRVIELESIPDEQPCRVIYAPPVYFTQPMGWFCDSRL